LPNSHLHPTLGGLVPGEAEANLDYVIQDKVFAVEGSILHLLEAEGTFTIQTQQSMKNKINKGILAEMGETHLAAPQL
jgi:glutathione synthase/RimK-type ligase-like ATP-grasp enzyme